MWQWNHWVFHIVYSISIFLDTLSVYRVLQTFWTYFSVGFGQMQIRSKTWPLGMILFCNILSSLKMTEKMTRMKLKFSEFNTVPLFFCAEFLSCSTCFLIPLPENIILTKHNCFLLVYMRTKTYQHMAVQHRYHKIKFLKNSVGIKN